MSEQIANYCKCFLETAHQEDFKDAQDGNFAIKVMPSTESEMPRKNELAKSGRSQKEMQNRSQTQTLSAAA